MTESPQTYDHSLKSSNKLKAQVDSVGESVLKTQREKLQELQHEALGLDIARVHTTLRGNPDTLGTLASLTPRRPDSSADDSNSRSTSDESSKNSNEWII